MADTRTEEAAKKATWAKAGCGWAMLVVVVAVVVGLVWGGIALVQAFRRWEPPIEYDEATTQEVKAPAENCDLIGQKLPKLPESKRLDVKAQLEHSALEAAVPMACDLDVKVECDPGSNCSAAYGGKRIVLAVQRGSCTYLPSIGERRCAYTLRPENRFLSQRRLNEAFWEARQPERKDGSLLRCDTIPGGADVLPPDPAQDDETAPTATKTKYRCYARKPGSLTHTYAVVAGRGSHISFEPIEN